MVVIAALMAMVMTVVIMMIIHDDDHEDDHEDDDEYDVSISPTLEFSPSMIRWGWAWEAGLHSGISCRNTELKE